MSRSAIVWIAFLGVWVSRVEASGFRYDVGSQKAIISLKATATACAVDEKLDLVEVPLGNAGNLFHAGLQTEFLACTSEEGSACDKDDPYSFTHQSSHQSVSWRTSAGQVAIVLVGSAAGEALAHYIADEEGHGRPPCVSAGATAFASCSFGVAVTDAGKVFIFPWKVSTVCTIAGENCSFGTTSGSWSFGGASGGHYQGCGSSYIGASTVLDVAPGIEYGVSGVLDTSVAANACCVLNCGEPLCNEFCEVLARHTLSVGMRYAKGTDGELCPGDANGDGSVNSADLGIVLAAYDSKLMPDDDPLIPPDAHYNADADFDVDGDVDQADLGAVISNYNTDCP